MSGPIFTIGHSTHPIETFVDLLKGNGITAVADVRSSPYSRHTPQFNREALQRSLKENAIAYVFLGKELGARSDDPSCYEGGQVQYARLARTESFLAGIERVMQGAQSHQIALMCAEKDPLDCHRTLLVSRALVERGQPVLHLRADGTQETHEAAMRRLMVLVKVPESDMFRSHGELVDEACRLQEQRIAYVDEELATAGDKAQR
jgi:uncharacterized protein (DUF488 family)